MVKSYSGRITSLKSNEVFVFTSNIGGFHGAGSAGYASFNETGNVWRKHKYNERPNGWKGKWNVKGVGEGFQEGSDGKSYAIPTVTKPGAKRSRTKEEIISSIDKFYAFAKRNPKWKFYVAQDDTTGLSGLTADEMAFYYMAHPIPDNVYFKEEFCALLNNKLSHKSANKKAVTKTKKVSKDKQFIEDVVINPQWGKEMKLLKLLKDKYPSDLVYSINKKVDSLLWFFSDDGKNYLTKLEYLIKYKETEKTTYVLSETKIGEDKIVKLKYKTIKDFLKR